MFLSTVHTENQNTNNKRTDIFVFGVFLLLWSVNGYFVAGNLFKLALLFVGFSCIVVTSFQLRKDKSFVNLGVSSIVLLLIYWGIAFVNQQKTLELNIIVFDLICICLLFSGFLVSRNLSLFTQPSNNLTLFLSFLTFLGCLMFIRNQSEILALSTEAVSRIGNEGKDESINAVGMAYVNVNLFFVLFYLLRNEHLKKTTKVVVAAAIACCLVIIVSTAARGAMVYLILILLLYLLSRVKSISNLFSFVFKTLGIVALLFVLYFLLIDYFPVLQNKMMGTIERFETLIEFVSTGSGDGSADERKELYNVFFTGVDNFILFGEKGYSPYPHNQFMEIIMRWGVLLGGPLLIFNTKNFFKALRLCVSPKFKSSFLYLFIFCLLFSFAQSMSSMSLEMNRMMWLGLGAIAGYQGKVS